MDAFAHIELSRMRAGETWAEYSDRIDELLNSESPIFLRYYSSNRLFSDNARKNFFPPDLKALPLLTGDKRER